MIKRIGVVSVPVKDQDVAKEFYIEKLGMKLVDDTSMGPNMRWVAVAPEKDSPTILTLVTWFDSMPAGSLRGLVLNCDDIEATAAELKKRGVKLNDDGIRDEPWGRFVLAEDPDGNGLIIQQNKEM